MTVLKHRESSSHLIDRGHNLEHLVPRNKIILVEVIHLEAPSELLLQVASGRNAEGAEELAKVDGVIAVGIESSENVLGKLGRVAERKEVRVDLLEFIDRQVARWTVCVVRRSACLELVK